MPNTNPVIDYGCMITHSYEYRKRSLMDFIKLSATVAVILLL